MKRDQVKNFKRGDVLITPKRPGPLKWPLGIYVFDQYFEDGTCRVFDYNGWLVGYPVAFGFCDDLALILRAKKDILPVLLEYKWK